MSAIDLSTQRFEGTSNFCLISSPAVNRPAVFSMCVKGINSADFSLPGQLINTTLSPHTKSCDKKRQHRKVKTRPRVEDWESNCWASAVFFNPRHLSGRPHSAGLLCGECPVGNNLLLGRPIASSCCGVSGSVGTDLLSLAAIQPAEHVESAAEAATKRETSYWSFSKVN